MRVALDARWPQRTPWDGVARSLGRTLPHLDATTDLTLLTDPSWPGLDPALAPRARVVPVAVPGPAAAWLQAGPPAWLARNRRAVDGFHTTWYGLPYVQPVPMACTIHDLTFEHRPEWMSRGRTAVFRAQARHAARTARRILVPSTHVAHDVARTYRFPADRIDVVPAALDPIFGPAAARPVAGLPERYVVALAGAQRRRVDLAEAAWRAAGRPLPLVVVGGAAAPTVDGVHRPGRLSDGDWPAVLASADALLYPTEDEGFGLPALEAAASRTRLVARPVASLPEVAGDTPVWVEDATPEAFGAGLLAALASSDAQLDAGVVWAAGRPTWAESAVLARRSFVLAFG